MAFEVSRAINDIGSKINSTPIKSIISSPFYVSILIVFLILIITIFTFRNVKMPKKTSKFNFYLRFTVYIFIATILIVFLHNNYLVSDMNKKIYNKDVDDVFDNMRPENKLGLDRRMGVNPRLDFQSDPQLYRPTSTISPMSDMRVNGSMENNIPVQINGTSPNIIEQKYGINL